MKQNCTLLLSTYDGGDDLWEGFFRSLEVFWPELDLPIAINTEHKHYSYGRFKITNCNIDDSKKEMSWGKRLVNALEQIRSEFVLFFLEDYWLDSPVDDTCFRTTLKWMEENPEIATMSFYPCMSGQNIEDDRFERFELRPQICEYKLNCQVALWRRQKLIDYIRPHESPWEWEVWGSRRAARYKEKFYTLKVSAKKVFSYGDPEIGCLIHRGKWNVEVAEQMAQILDIEIDYNKRGIEDWDQIYEERRLGQDVKKNSLLVRVKRPHLVQYMIGRIWQEVRMIKSLL